MSTPKWKRHKDIRDDDGDVFVLVSQQLCRHQRIDVAFCVMCRATPKTSASSNSKTDVLNKALSGPRAQEIDFEGMVLTPLEKQ